MLDNLNRKLAKVMAVLVLLQVTVLQPPARAGTGAPPGVPAEAAAEAHRLAAAFQKKYRGRSEKRFEELLHQVEEQVPEVSAQTGSRQVASLREILSTSRDLPDTKTRKRSGRESTAHQAPDSAQAIVYRFGTRSFQATDPKNRRLIQRLLKQPSLEADMLSAQTRLEWTLQGALADAELLVAVLEAELDVLRDLDELALLLESWKHQGPLSFYQELDRATRTGEEVFYLDSQLEKFVDAMAPRVGRRWSPEQKRQKFHSSFLTYRQYRSFIEAVAWSLVLPPDLPLPAHLARYDYGAVEGSGDSVRHELDILLDEQAGDSRAVVSEVRQVIESCPFPAVPWQSYSLAAEFNQHFSRQASSIANRAGLHTDSMGERNRAQRCDVSRHVATEMRARLGC